MATIYGDPTLLPTLLNKQKGGNQSLVGVDNNNTLIGDVDFIIGSGSEVSLVGSTSHAKLPLPADSGAKSPSVPAQRAQPLRLKKPTQSGATWPVCCEACGEG